ncbi:MAG: hypothetical protein COV31_01005 [Candidatus Yanofskybacteria bacterium CG10_big_fil_rev_8_21_14_0_10_46_23]|uniref:POTRA domain-containing protein n=1 Tax=Candidatus Yanofskybacteria bacterium CG10_big_fil_rev_8_21_14_0_10_46_23 TaxID=1975098 RepID=A0A2H0R532_9BACT|nr:MAG: hypothetical protein COV31_01005 [Candidatus Yanofskybacteria bacterium CG10_big_fil_rev_8_21_14_0_10_46_23]
MKHQRLRWAFLALGLLVVLGVGIYGLFFADLFNVEAIEISGNSAINHNLILDSVNQYLENRRFNIPRRLNIFLVNKDSLAEAIRGVSSRIETVKIKKGLFHEIKVEITEFKTFGVWCQLKIDQCFSIDKAGRAFEEAPASSGLILLHVDDHRDKTLEIGQTVLEKDWLEQLILARELLDQKLELKTLNIVLVEDGFGEYQIETNEGWRLLLKRDLSTQNQIDALSIFLEKELTKSERANLTYVDARIKNRFYYQ